jgi:hypothetical protein
MARSRAFLASGEAAFVSLPWFFHWDLLLLRAEIPELAERILSGAQHRCSVVFLQVWL